MYAIYANPGTLDLRAITIQGLTAKPSAEGTPIGYFGTGLKYALACALRMGLKMTIQDGTGRIYEAQAEPADFRGKAFDQCRLVLRGEYWEMEPSIITLPFTTEYGRDWEMWEVMRELESNARDERGRFYMTPDYPPAERGQVRIIIEGEDFITCVEQERESAFLTPNGLRPLLKTAFFEVYDRPSPYLYQRGVRVHESTSHFAFTYNLLGKNRLTENRTLANTYALGGQFGELLNGAHLEVAKKLARTPHSGEWQHISDYDLPGSMTEPFLQWLRAYAKAGKIAEILNKRVWTQIIRKEMDRPKALSPEQGTMLEEARQLLLKFGYTVADFPIEVVENLPENTHALANFAKRKIFLTPVCFKSLPYLTSVLIEEWAHLAFDYRDCTREFQNWLFAQLTSAIFAGPDITALEAVREEL